MALRLSGRKQRGEDGGGGRHFNIHYHHPPSRVCTFSVLRGSPRFSLLSCVLTPLLLFFAVLAFLVLFVWFTLLYFVASLVIKDSNHESFKNGNFSRGSDVNKHLGEDSREEEKAESKTKAVKDVAELLHGDSARTEGCFERLEIEELHVDGFSELSKNISRMAWSDACLNCEVHTDYDNLVNEVILFENGREEFTSYRNSARYRDIPIDKFVEELNIEEVSTSGDSFPFVHSINSAQIHDFPDVSKVVGMSLDFGLSLDFIVENNQNMVVPSKTSSHHNVIHRSSEYGEEFVDDTKELTACSSYGICDFIDKHKTREKVLDGFGNEKSGPLTSSCGSALGGFRDEHKKESTEGKDEKIVLELLVDCVATLHSFKQQEGQKVPELLIIEANKKQSIGALNEVHDFTHGNETSVLSLCSLCEDTISSDGWSCNYIGYEDDKREDDINNNIIEGSDPACVVCDIVENHQTTTEAFDGFANDDNTGDMISLECSEGKDDKISDNRVSKGASHGLPLIRRSPAPWWNLCGVIDVFAGCED